MKKPKFVPESIKSVITKAEKDYKLEIFLPKEISPRVTNHPEFAKIYEIALNYSGESDIQVNCERPNQHDALLETIPVEFRGPLAYLAYEQGHSAGDSEIYNYLLDYVDAVKGAIEEFAKNRGIKL